MLKQVPILRTFCTLSFMAMAFSISAAQADDHWIQIDGRDGPGKGKHIVFVTGDDEYRSEEGMPMMAKILAVKHGFKCTVLFAIEPKTGVIKPDFQTNIPGTHLLEDADLMVLFTRFRSLPDEQMKPIVDFTNSGKPIIGLRTATHAFNIRGDSQYKKYSFNSGNPKGGYGQAVLGDTWISHHGHHGRQSTRGVVNAEHKDHPVLNSVTDVWGPSDVYGIRNLGKDAHVLLHGSVRTGMKPSDPALEGAKNDPMMPLAWIKEYKGESGKTSKVFNTTMGASTDLQSEDLRRLVVNFTYWSLGIEVPKKADVVYVDEYKPTNFGFGSFVKNKKPADYDLK
jgi:hypothetical protein